MHQQTSMSKHWENLYLGHDTDILQKLSLIVRFMGPIWGPSGADRTQVGPMLAPWTLLSVFPWNTLNRCLTYKWYLLWVQCLACTYNGVNSSPPGQNGCHFTDYIFKCIFMNEKFCIFIQSSITFVCKFVPKGSNDNKSSLVYVMAWHRIGSKPAPSLTNICDMRHSGKMSIWVRSRNCGCLFTWFCYQLIAKPGNKRQTQFCDLTHMSYLLLAWLICW